ncbi:MAG: hypothetical protein GQ550_03550, partial [Gammaproteobacteria bacterium]|nr:hypothetical protein [Gammaproteobacteria bacterium]
LLMGKITHTTRKRTQGDYTLGFKLSVIEQVESGEMTYKQAQVMISVTFFTAEAIKQR